MKKYPAPSTTLSLLIMIIMVSSCGRQARTSGFFAGAITGTSPTIGQLPSDDGPATPMVPGDTLVNCLFDTSLDRPFGPSTPFEVYGGALQLDNRPGSQPVVLLSTAGLVRDGMIEARFNLVDAPLHSVVGLVLRAADEQNFVLLGVNSRGQYTVQECRNGMWFTVMGLGSFERSRLLPFSMPSVELSAQVHGSYIDFFVNGQLIQVVRLRMPAMGVAGVFADAGIRVELDRFTVIPSL
jgi:hypothetical protein